MSLDRRTLAWLRDHHATITSAALDAGGINRDARRRLVACGVLERVVDGGYRFAGAGDDEWSRCAALCTSRPRLVVAGPTAGRLWELRRAPRDGLVHVVAPPRSNPCSEPWVRVYRTAALPDDDVVERPDGIRLTSPPRTVVDMTRYVDEVALASMIEDVLARRVCTAGDAAAGGRTARQPGSPVGPALHSSSRYPDARCASRVGVGASRVRRTHPSRRTRSCSSGRGRAPRLRQGPIRRRHP